MTESNRTADSQAPDAVVQAGERIYQARYRSLYESRFPGKLLLIDVENGRVYRGESVAEVLRLAESQSPQGAFYLRRVGSESLYRL